MRAERSAVDKGKGNAPGRVEEITLIMNAEILGEAFYAETLPLLHPYELLPALGPFDEDF